MKKLLMLFALFIVVPAYAETIRVSTENRGTVCENGRCHSEYSERKDIELVVDGPYLIENWILGGRSFQTAVAAHSGLSDTPGEVYVSLYIEDMQNHQSTLAGASLSVRGYVNVAGPYFGSAETMVSPSLHVWRNQ